MRNIYLDNSATTRISEEALEKYIEVSRSSFGNPSSLHSLGFDAEKEINRARELVLTSVGAKGSTVIFTASGSEANNLAITGRALSKDRYRKNGKILTTKGEHSSVTAPLERLSAMGFKVVEIPTEGGKLDREALLRELTSDVILITMMMVNNETGALYDVADVSKLMRTRCPEAVLHVDATQSFMKIPFTKSALGADMITLSSHKIEGPKGVGALVVDERVIKARGLSALILGGGQEGGMRSGTENVPGIAAFGKACEIGAEKIEERRDRLNSLRDYLIERITNTESLGEVSLTLPERHAPQILNLTLPGIKSETMLHFLSSEGVFVSSGSACSSNGQHKASPALVAYGRTAAEADCSIRVSFCHTNTKEDVDALVDSLIAGISKLQRIKR